MSAIDPTAVLPATRRSTGRLFRLMLWLHRWTGLVATPFFLVLVLTGGVLIFHEEIDDAMGITPAAESGAGAALPLDRVVAAARAEAPTLKPQSIFIDPKHPDAVMVSMAPRTAEKLEEGLPHIFDARTAKALGAVDYSKTLTGFLLELHANWFAGPLGQLFGGVIALLVLICLISGIYVYAPYVKNVAFGLVRRGRGARLVQLDLHNLGGAIVLGWATVVTVTAVFLALATIALGLWQNTELREMAAQGAGASGAPIDVSAPPVGVDAAVAAARTVRADRNPSFILFPGTELSSPRHYTVLMFGQKGYEERMFDVVLVDAGTGKVADARALPWYLQVILVSEPLHFGDYGGLPLKILWLLCSFMTLFITGNGAWLWWMRRRKMRGAKS